MIKRKKQKVISKFGYRTRAGKKEFHAGIDLRSWNLKIWKRQPIIFPERCEVVRMQRSGIGGIIVYRGMETEYYFKSMHIKINDCIIEGGVYETGEIIGYSEKVKGMDEHEHFEVLHTDTGDKDINECKKHWQDFWIDPLNYFDKRGVPYA